MLSIFKKTILFIFLFTSILGFSKQSFASWFAEPYTGYELGIAKSATKASNILNNRISGLFFGARVGYSFLNFSAGLEHSISKSQWKRHSITPQDSFVFGSFGIPGLKVMAAIGLSHKFKTGFAEGAKEFSGEAYKFSFVFTGAPFININAEYLWRRFSPDKSKNFHKILRISLGIPLP